MVTCGWVRRCRRCEHAPASIRARYAEDRLWEAVSAGVQQYVILGSGLDTFALRSRGACGSAARL